MCINQDTKFEVCSITNSKNMIGARFLKVAQLLLMHQRTRCITANSKILKQSRDHNHAYLGVICRPFGKIRYSLPV